MAEDVIDYEILTPVGRVSRGKCSSIVAPAIHGEIGILKNHTPFLSALTAGVVHFETGGKTERVFVGGGFIEVLSNKVVILAETSEDAAHIDIDRAKASRDRAKKRLDQIGKGSTEGSIDRARARRSYDRALARLKTAGAA